MCDIEPGKLILGFPSFDPAGHALVRSIREGEIDLVTYVESMEEKLGRLEMQPHKELDYSLHLVEVPVGEEQFKVTYLQFFYKIRLFEALRVPPDPRFAESMGRSASQFVAAPSQVLSLSAAGSTSAQPLSALGHSFGQHYATYRQMVGLPARFGSQGVRIMVVDTGIANDATLNVVTRKNIVDPANSSVDDDNGHGTAVALVINDLAPGGEFVIFKAADANGHIGEWDLLAALVADTGSRVINISAEYGLGTRICGTCGRQSHSSRSAVFENVLDGLNQLVPAPIVVAAAGNGSAPELAFPARFANVVAAGAINSQKVLASDSNYGNADQAGRKHHNHFVLPGGDAAPNQEDVIVLANGSSWHGTSLATAFGSAILATSIAGGAQAPLASLRSNVDTGFPKYNSVEHGHGIPRI
jgi:Subtilase family